MSGGQVAVLKVVVWDDATKSCANFMNSSISSSFLFVELLTRSLKRRTKMGSLIRFYSFVIWLGIFLALIGQLRSCTLIMMGLASEKSQKGIMSYSKLTKILTDDHQ